MQNTHLHIYDVHSGYWAAKACSLWRVGVGGDLGRSEARPWSFTLVLSDFITAKQLHNTQTPRSPISHLASRVAPCALSNCILLPFKRASEVSWRVLLCCLITSRLSLISIALLFLEIWVYLYASVSMPARSYLRDEAVHLTVSVAYLLALDLEPSVWVLTTCVCRCVLLHLRPNQHWFQIVNITAISLYCCALLCSALSWESIEMILFY